jgi:tRNA dimethylallyltransferase
MAIYRGMDIGTAKPTVDQQGGIAHHLIDILEPTESFSVSAYVQEAHRIASEIKQRGKHVLVSGGTPLYLKSLLRGLFLGPEADWEFRDAVEQEVERSGEKVLRDRLEQVDPLLAHKLHPNDRRRAIRALEVARITGRPLSHWQQQFETPASRDDCPVIVLRLARSWLHERINTRVDEMIADGLVDEVRGLLNKYSALGRTAAQAVGYKEVISHLSGDVTLPEATELIKAHTRQFARRQEIWFRGLSELHGLEVTPESTVEQLADGADEWFTRNSNDSDGQTS